MKLTAANAIHSTPVHEIMSAFSYFDESSKQNGHDNNKNNKSNNDNDGNGGGGGSGGSGGSGSSDGGGGGGGNGNGSGDGGGDNGGCGGGGSSNNDPFLPPFTPRSCMHILHWSFVSNSSTSYLVLKEPVKSLLNLIKPVHEDPYFIQEPDWLLV